MASTVITAALSDSEKRSTPTLVPLRARTAIPVSKPAPAKIAWSSFENARFAKFGRNLAGPVSKPELLNGP